MAATTFARSQEDRLYQWQFLATRDAIQRARALAVHGYILNVWILHDSTLRSVVVK